jgi:NAD(P)-dependent dehydrogenase (short-subunit alcohol dehydrogenase family)
MLAKTLAMEWADQGILVNTINPGYVEYVGFGCKANKLTESGRT